MSGQSIFDTTWFKPAEGSCKNIIGSGLDWLLTLPHPSESYHGCCAPCPAVAAATAGLLQHCSGKPVQYCRRVPHQHQWQRGGEGVNRIGRGIGRRIFIWLGREARRSYQCWWVAPPTSSAERAAADCSTAGSIHKQRQSEFSRVWEF